MEGVGRLGCAHVSQSNKMIFKNCTVVPEQTVQRPTMSESKLSTKDARAGAGTGSEEEPALVLLFGKPA